MFQTRKPLLVLIAVCGLFHMTSQTALADGAVSGTVTLNGSFLAQGKITFYRDNGQFYGSKIKDGKFAIDRMPEGTFKVTVEGKKVPAKFDSEETSVLTMTVKDGANAFALDLTD